MRDVDSTREEFITHEPQAGDLRILRVFFQVVNQLLLKTGSLCNAIQDI